jgi:hypothetical protein
MDTPPVFGDPLDYMIQFREEAVDQIERGSTGHIHKGYHIHGAWSWTGINLQELRERVFKVRARAYLESGEPITESLINIPGMLTFSNHTFQFGSLGEVELLAERRVDEEAFVFRPDGGPRHPRDGLGINIASGNGIMRLLIYRVWYCGIYDVRVRFSDGRVGTIRNLPGRVLHKPHYTFPRNLTKQTRTHPSWSQQWHVELGWGGERDSWLLICNYVPVTGGNPKGQAKPRSAASASFA